MCSIIGFSKRSVPKEAALAGFEKTKSRGPDMDRFAQLRPGQKVRFDTVTQKRARALMRETA